MNIVVHRVSAVARCAIGRHFLALPAEDRRLRFGATLDSLAIGNYVERIDFDRDAVFAIHDDDLAVVGLAHVAFQGDAAELGLSVLPALRGQGAGAALFERAATHVRNRFVTAVYMLCLPENAAVVRLARRIGMKITHESDEARACLAIPPASAMSIADELTSDGLARLDYALKQYIAILRRVDRVQLAAMRHPSGASGRRARPIAGRGSTKENTEAASLLQRCIA